MNILKGAVTNFCFCQLILIVLLATIFTFSNLLPYWGHILLSILIISISIHLIRKLIILFINTQDDKYEYILSSSKEHVDKLLNQLEVDKQETNAILSKLIHLNAENTRNITNTFKLQSELIIQESLNIKEFVSVQNDQYNKSTLELIKNCTERIIAVHGEVTQEILRQIDDSLYKITTNIESKHKLIKELENNIEKCITKNNQDVKYELQKQTNEVLNIYDQNSIQIEDQNAKITKTILNINKDLQDIITEKLKSVYEKINQSFISTSESISEEGKIIQDIINTTAKLINEKHERDYQDTLFKLKTIDENFIILTEKVKDNGLNLKKQNELIVESNNEFKASLDDNSLRTLNIITTNTSLVIEKINKIQKDIYNSAEELSNKLESNKTETKSLLSNIENQNQFINKKADIIIKNSDELKDELLNINNFSKETKSTNTSIELYIHKLEEDFTKHFDEIEEQILSSQIQQNDIKYEIKNLFIILGSLKNILEYKDRREDNIETYLDERTSNTVENHYKNGILSKSVMKQQDGKIIYELLYREGNIEKSIQYNEDGKIAIEQTFYSNGEVHYRNEYTYRDGKDEMVVTEFNEIGNKIKQ